MTWPDSIIIINWLCHVFLGRPRVFLTFTFAAYIILTLLSYVWILYPETHQYGISCVFFFFLRLTRTIQTSNNNKKIVTTTNVTGVETSGPNWKNHLVINYNQKRKLRLHPPWILFVLPFRNSVKHGFTRTTRPQCICPFSYVIYSFRTPPTHDLFFSYSVEDSYVQKSFVFNLRWRMSNFFYCLPVIERVCEKKILLK